MFLDLNGTLVEPLKQERPDELTLIGVAESVARLTAAGFVCPVVTACPTKTQLIVYCVGRRALTTFIV